MKNRIAELRKARGMTQQQLADATGVHWVTISNLERGKTQLTNGWMHKLSEVFRVDAYEIFGPMPKRTVLIEGALSKANGIEVYDHEDQDRRPVEITDPGDIASLWIEVTDDAWSPFFHVGDLIQFSWLPDSVLDMAVGRMCLFEIAEDQYVAGLLETINGPKDMEYRTLSGHVRSRVAPVSVGIITGYYPYGFVDT